VWVAKDKNSMNGSRKYLTGNAWRQPILLINMITMLTGVLFSRAMLSIGLIVFIITCLFHKNIMSQLKIFFFSPVLWSMSLLFFVPLISGLWSEEHTKWLDIIRIKLPLLLFPVCFADLKNFKQKDWEKISYSFLILICTGVCWSLWQYFQHIETINANYLKASTIQTPLGNDHVRFSLLVTIGILNAVFLLFKIGSKQGKVITGLLILTILFFISYLHVLAVRTGLMCFYSGIFIFIIWVVWKQRNEKRYIWILSLVFLLPVISYFVVPTFQNRIKYLKYDLSLVRKKVFVSGSNDGNRFFSIKAGWQLLRQNPVTGVGFGDIEKETNKIYEVNNPGATATDKILPSSEWMMYGAGAGWPGFVLFSFSMLIPFFIKELRNNIVWLLINIFIAFSYLFDIGLEVQYGVFVHAFILLWWYKWLRLQ
jgi:hypothetical protein